MGLCHGRAAVSDCKRVRGEMDDHSILMWLVVAGLGIGGSLIGWLLARTVSRLDTDMKTHAVKLEKHDSLHNQCTVDLERFKTEVAKEYAKDSSVQASLSRLYAMMEQGFGEIRGDIKSILEKMK